MEVLKEKAEAFLAVLARLSSSQDDTRRVTSEIFEQIYLITFCPAPSDSCLHRLLPPVLDSTEGGNTNRHAPFVLVSRPPLRDADVTLADLTYSSDHAPDEGSLATSELDKLCIAQFTADEVRQVVCSAGQAPNDAKSQSSLLLVQLSSGVVFQPLSKDEARYILSLHSLALNMCFGLHSSVPDVFVISHSVGQGEQYGDVSLQGSCSTEIHGTPGTQMVLATALREADKGQCCPLLSKHASAHAVYESGPGMDCEEGGAQVVAEVTWAHPKEIQCPPPVTANATLHVTATFGAPTLPLHRIYQELLYLNKYVSIVDKTVPCYLHDMNPAQDSPFSVERFLSEYEKMATASMEHSYEAVLTSDITLENSFDDQSVINLRKSNDFLEFLWEKVHTHTNTDQLQDIFHQVFELIMAKKVQPFLLRSNTSTLASLIRQILSPRDSTRHLQLEVKDALSGDNFVRHFAQLGLLKVAQDIRYVFAGHRLLPRADLQDLTRVVSKPPAEAFFTLVRHYKALEVTLVAEVHFGILGTPLHPLACTALHYFKENSSLHQRECSPTFQLSFPPQSEGVKSIVALCKHHQPTIWKAFFTEGKTTKLFVFSSSPLLYGQGLQFLDTTATDSTHMYEVTMSCIE